MISAKKVAEKEGLGLSCPEHFSGVTGQLKGLESGYGKPQESLSWWLSTETEIHAGPA